MPRLSAATIEGLIQVLTPYLQEDVAELRLYGSRVNEKKTGGDLDLLLVLESSKLAIRLNESKHDILARFKQKLGDQKIDLIITQRARLKTDVFLQLILPESVLLKCWVDGQTDVI